VPTYTRMSSGSAGAPLVTVTAAATIHEKAAWILVAVGLIFIIHFGLLPALLAGLLLHAVVQGLGRFLYGRMLSHHGAKIVALGAVTLVIIAAAAVVAVLLVAFLRGRLGNLPALMDRMASVLETLRDRLGGGAWIPAADDLQDTLTRMLREHARELQHAGGEIGHVFIGGLAGTIIGALATFEARRPTAPLSAALFERLARLARAFERVVFAQVEISALNTIFTAVFLFGLLPLAGIHLPLRKTLVCLTFLAGMLPVLGNLVSNTTIVVIALGVSLPAAITALVFLVVVHKLEYFLNARIVGGHIHAAAWEILAAMLALEAVFGLPGVIIAPIVYAYAKGELVDRGLI
jgi:predicted PurR-regulated permease PerM